MPSQPPRASVSVDDRAGDAVLNRLGLLQPVLLDLLAKRLAAERLVARLGCRGHWRQAGRQQRRPKKTEQAAHRTNLARRPGGEAGFMATTQESIARDFLNGLPRQYQTENRTLPSAAEQLANFGADVCVFHQRLAHQDGLGAALRQSLDISAGVDAAFGDQERRQVACCVLRVA